MFMIRNLEEEEECHLSQKRRELGLPAVGDSFQEPATKANSSNAQQPHQNLYKCRTLESGGGQTSVAQANSCNPFEVCGAMCGHV